MLKIKVDPRTGLCYIPKSIRREGFTGNIELLDNALTVTLIKPGTKLADVGKSLQLIREGIALRIQQEGADAKRKAQRNEHSPSSEGDEETNPKRLHPIFTQYRRGWLVKVTGYSEGYLSRLARGRIPLSQSFIERCCFRLQESEEVLFCLTASEV